MRKIAALSILTLLAVGLILAVMGGASAKSSYMGDFDSAYPTSPLTGDCSVCHTSVPALNSYGSDFQAANYDFAAIATIDSDGDGASNATEIAAGSYPGNAASMPPTTTTTTLVTTTTTVPGPTTTTVPSVTTTTAPSVTTTTMPGPTTTTTMPQGAMTETWDVANAGQVTITHDGNRILDVQVTPMAGWTFEIDKENWNKVEIEFKSMGDEVEFEAKLRRGEFKIKIEIESDDDHDDDSDHDDDDSDHHDHDDDDDDDHDD